MYWLAVAASLLFLACTSTLLFLNIRRRRWAERALREHQDHLEELVNQRSEALRKSQLLLNKTFASLRDSLLIMWRNTRNAGLVAMRLRWCMDSVEILVADDGCRFHLRSEAAMNPETHFRSRTTASGGSTSGAGLRPRRAPADPLRTGERNGGQDLPAAR